MCIILFICCCIWLTSILLRIFASMGFPKSLFRVFLRFYGQPNILISDTGLQFYLLMTLMNIRVYSSRLVYFVVVQSLSHVRLFATPWTATRQASLSFTIFQSLLKHMSIEPVMSSNHLILYRPLFLLPSIFLSIRVFSNELALRIR